MSTNTTTKSLILLLVLSFLQVVTAGVNFSNVSGFQDLTQCGKHCLNLGQRSKDHGCSTDTCLCTGEDAFKKALTWVDTCVSGDPRPEYFVKTSGCTGSSKDFEDTRQAILRYCNEKGLPPPSTVFFFFFFPRNRI